MNYPAQRPDPEHPQDVLGGLAKWLADTGNGFTWYAEQIHRLSQQRQEDVGLLRQELAGLQKDQDARLSELLRLHNQLRQEISGAAEVRHQDLAGAFRDLVQQEVVPTAMRVDGLCPNAADIDPQQRRVTLTRLLCRLLFGALPTMNHEVRTLFQTFVAGAGPEAETQAKALAKPLCAKVNRLRLAIADTGTPFRWDFEVAPGTPYSPEQYHLWPAASDQAPVQYVVVPAYVVPGRPPYQRAIVCTALLPQSATPVQHP